MCTSIRCEKRSAVCTCIDTTVSCGASSLNVDAHPAQASMSAASSSPRTRRSLGMVQGVRRHEDDAFLRHQESLRVLAPVVTDARARRELAILVDDGIADLAVRP